jgi:hypothetical protein
LRARTDGDYHFFFGIDNIVIFSIKNEYFSNHNKIPDQALGGDSVAKFKDLQAPREELHPVNIIKY